MHKPACLVCILALLLLDTGCGGSRSVPELSLPQAGVASVPQSHAEVLAQLDALATPPGVDAAVFSQLKDALQKILDGQSTARLVSSPPTGQMNRIEDLTSGVNDSGHKGIQWNYKNVGDYDFNSQVNLGDLTLVGVHFGKNSASPDWMSAARFADGDKNGVINVSDVTPIGVNFLHRVAGYLIAGAPAPEGSFTQIGQAAFDTGRPLLSGIRMYHYLPAVQHPYYQVTPVDELSNPGEPSLPSVDFLISDETRVIGAPGGPSFVSRNGDDVTVLLPDGGPSPIQAGDVVVGAEDGGYLLRVLSIQQVGATVNITGTPGILADVFLQGGLAQALDDISQVPPAVYTLNLAGQVLHNEQALQATITSGTLTFLPQADVAVNYNEYGGVTYLRGLAEGGPLDLDMTVQVTSTKWNGTFPPTPDDVPFFERKMTGFTFDFTAYQNDVPVTMTLQYDVYVGIRGSGNLNSTYQAHIVSTYDKLMLGGIYNSTGIHDLDEFTTSYGAVSAPYIGMGGGDFTFTAYVRPEIHIKLYGNPVPGNSEDLALTLSPQLTLTGQRTSTPERGYDYTLDGSLDNSFLLILHHIGLDDDPQSRFFPGAVNTVLSGFIADSVPPG